MEIGEPSKKQGKPTKTASILVRTQFNALPLTGVEVELRPGGVKRTDDKGECKYSQLEPGRYEVCMKGDRIWLGKVREADELKLCIVATGSYARCCHIASAPPKKVGA